VLLTIAAGLSFPGGGLLVGLSFAYIVYGDDPDKRFGFAMLAGIVTMVWALAILGLSGVGGSVTTHTEPPVVVHAAGN
jgi:hypothetical protein